MKLSNSQREELLSLCWALHEEALSPAQQSRLEELLAASDEARQSFIEYRLMAAEIEWQYLDEHNPASAARERWWQRAGRRAVSLATQPKPISLTLAAIILGIIVCTMALVVVPSYRAGFQSATAEMKFVARITGVGDAVWEDQESGLRLGSSIAEGTLVRLKSGLMEVTFKSGAVVLVGGPARLMVVGDNQSALDFGLLTAFVPTRAKGFRVAAPSVSIVDLGTEFGMRVDQHGTTDVRVFDGEVEASSDPSKARPFRRVMHAGDAIRVSIGGQVATSTSREKDFVRRNQVVLASIKRNQLPVVSYSYEGTAAANMPTQWPDSLSDGQELTNGRIAGPHYTDEEWVGFNDSPDSGMPQPVITFDLGSRFLLDDATVTYFHSAGVPEAQAGESVQAPQRVDVSFSDDGQHFSTPITLQPFNPSAGSEVRTSRLKLQGIEGRYVRLNFHQAAPWTFLTEVRFYGRTKAATEIPQRSNAAQKEVK